MTGHIRRRGKRSWAIVLNLGRDANGKRRQKWHTVHGTKRDAQKELTNLLHSLNNGTYVEPTRQTVADYLNEWLSHAKSKVSAKTLERYSEICRLHLSPAFGHITLAQLHPVHIQNYYTEALESGRRDGKGGLAAQTVLHHHRVLHKALQQAVRLRLIARNPAAADSVEPPRPQRKQVRTLDEAQSQTLLGTLKGTRLEVPTLIALTTGMRRGEILALTWKRVDFEAGALGVWQSLQQTKAGLAIKPPKTGSGRTVALPPMALTALRKHKVRQAEERLMLGPDYQDNGLVFPKYDGSLWEPNSFTSSFLSAVRRSGLPHVNFHALRHTHATILMQQGINPKVVSERLGHAKVATTLDIYSHVLPGMQEEAALQIERALGTTTDAN